MKCVHCGNEQAVGQFCLRCGTRLEESVQKVSGQGEVSHEHAVGEVFVEKVDASVQLEHVKTWMKQYGNYFLQHLKHPSISFSGKSQEVANGVVSLLLFAIIFSLTVLLAIKGILLESFVGLEAVEGNVFEVPSNFLVFWHVFLFVFVCMVIVVFALHLIAKLFGPEYPSKMIVQVYSAHSLPAIVIGLAALALILLKSGFYASVVLIASLIYMLILAPSYVTAVFLSKRPKGMDPLYGFTVYAVVLTVSFVILFTLIEDSAVRSYLSSLKFLL